MNHHECVYRKYGIKRVRIRNKPIIKIYQKLQCKICMHVKIGDLIRTETIDQ